MLCCIEGASGSGKTTIAQAIEEARPEWLVFRFDTIGVPSSEAMSTFENGHQPGGAWQRAMTLQWFDRIVPLLQSGKSVLFEGQMRIAFIQEALTVHRLSHARVILVDCDDATRAARLAEDRRQPELADESMMGWARYLREEALAAGFEIPDTGVAALAVSVERVASYFA